MLKGGEGKARFDAAGRGRWGVAIAAAAAVLLTSCLPASAFLARPVIFAAIGAAVKAPTGWLKFCSDNPDECRSKVDEQNELREVTLSPDLLQQLFAINSYVNTRVKWTSDKELYGESEHWAYPLDRGDCEDFVLLKRRMLAKSGWPTSALLITTVQDPATRNELHAVLTVHTDRGDLVLDNQTPEILFWYETNYRYLTRQSPRDPNVWVSITGK